MADENWADKIAAQQRHEHLAATVRIIVGELCYLAEQSPSPTAEQIYACTEVLENALKEGEVAYEEPAAHA